MVKTRKSSLVILFSLVIALALFCFSACGKKQYTITFNPNYPGGENTTVTVEEGKTVAEQDALTRAGYRFDGWFTSASATEQFDFSKAINSDLTVYAGWTQVYKITLDYNGGGNGEELEVAVGERIEIPEEPVRAGYAFKGWYTAAEGGAEYNFNTPPVKDMTLYAHWAEAYAITLNYNYDGEPDNGVYYAEKGAVSSGPVSPERDGYAFNGWYTDAGCTATFSFARPINSDTTIYAGWKQQFVLEAEYVDFTGKKGSGYSGTASGTDMIGWDRDGSLGASNGYYVSYLYDPQQTLTFNFISDSAVTDADITVRISAEFFDQTFSSVNYSVVLNDSALPWEAVSIQGTQNPAFIDVVIGKQLTLREGTNKIELITNNTTSIGGTMKASAPLVDCVKIATSAALSWEPKTGNIE